MHGKFLKFLGCNRNLLIIVIAVIAMVALIAPKQGFSYERMVLIEDFTNTRCGPCYSWTPYFVDGMGGYEAERLAVVAIHVWWPGDDDPWFIANEDENRARIGQYGVGGVPSFWIDGDNVALFNPPEEFQAAVQGQVQERLETESPIMMNAVVGVFDETFRTMVSVTSDRNLNRLKLMAGMVEIFNNYQPPNSNYPPGHHDALLDLIPDNSGTAFDITEGETKTFFLESSRDIGWDRNLQLDNMQLVVWVQASNRDVHQAFETELGVGTFVALTDWVISDEANGDNDTRPEPGEVIDGFVNLQAAPYNEDAESVTVTVSTDDEGITFINDTFELDGLDAGNLANNNDDPIQFRVSEDFQAHIVTFTVTVTAQPGDVTMSNEYEYMFGWPNILVVDASSSPNAAEVMMDLFGWDILPCADRWDRNAQGIFTGDGVNNYNAVIWHGFNNNGNYLEVFEEEVLTAYLDAGGTLIFSSAETMANLAEHQSLANHLGIELDSSDINLNWVKGYEGDPHFDGVNLFLGAGQGAGFPDKTPSLTCMEGAEPVLWYDDGGENAGIAAVKYETDTYKALTIAFPVESIGGVAGTDLLEPFMERVWDWTGISDAAPSIAENVPVEFAIHPVYPNPFNSTVTVPFSIENSGSVRIALFDLAGREVQTLVDGETSAGNHSVSFNAQQAGLSSGIYYVKMTSGSQVASQKVLYLR